MNEDTYQNQQPEEQPQEQVPEAQAQTPAPEEQAHTPGVEQQQAPPQAPPQYTYQTQQAPPNQGYTPPPPGQYPYGAPRQQRNGSKYWWLAAGLGIGCLGWLFFIFIIIVGIPMIAGVANEPRGEHIALIHVNGVITASQSGGGLLSGSTSGSEDLVSELERARQNPDAKAVVIRINSPGGSPSGSEEVYNAIMRLRDDGKPVYISMGDVAASGGYYIASAADKIYADSSTITGSIGVIFQTADMSTLYKKIGYTPETIKSGKFKDIGSPARPLTPEDRQLIKGIVMNTYDQFVQAVAKGRKMKVADVRAIADGRVFTGEQALKIKLVDNIGGLHETVRAAAKAGGISGEPAIEDYGTNHIFGSFFGSSESSVGGMEKEVGRRVLEKLLSDEEPTSGLR